MRWLVRIFFALVLLVVLLVGALFLLPADKIAALARDQVKAATGRELTLEGRIKPSIWPQIGVQAGPVALSNADWASDTPMLRAETLRVGLDPVALLTGDIVIRELQVSAPEILLEQSADGQANWEFGAADSAGAGATEASGTTTAFTIDAARIRDGALRYVDHASGADYALDDVDLTLSLPAFNGPAKLALSAQMNGAPLRADLDMGNFGAALGGEVSSIALDAALAGAEVKFDGRAGLEPLAADGTLDASADNLSSVLAALGQAADLPPGLGKVFAKGQVTLAPEGSVHLRDGQLGFAGNVLSGEVDLIPGATRPRLNGSLSTGTLNLIALSGGESGSSGGSSSSGWSTDPIDVSGLAALDASLALTAEGVNLPGLTLGATRVLATLDDRRLVFDLRELRAYDGVITGEFVTNGRGGLSVGGDLNIAGIALGQALADMADYSSLSGTGNIEMNFLASGGSEAALANSLSGAGALAFSDGVMQGIDLASIFRLGKADSGGSTVFEKATASFAINGGVLSNQDFVLTGPRIQATGDGTVSIGAQTLNYSILPATTVPIDGGKKLRVPLKITGSWANPKLQLDLGSVIDDKIDKQVEKIETEVKEKAEEEVRKGLKKLLGK